VGVQVPYGTTVDQRQSVVDALAPLESYLRHRAAEITPISRHARHEDEEVALAGRL
jgi:hypothetical protein